MNILKIIFNSKDILSDSKIMHNIVKYIMDKDEEFEFYFSIEDKKAVKAFQSRREWKDKSDIKFANYIAIDLSMPGIAMSMKYFAKEEKGWAVLYLDRFGEVLDHDM